MALIVIPFALGYYVSYLLRTVNAVVSPSLTSELGLTASGLGLLTSAYFVGFGLAQLPVGIALDRYGPRRVEGILLLVAAAGSAAFAVGGSMVSLTGARFFIGLGVSACLMAAVKGISLWYPPEKQSSKTGFVMAAGALGALTASKPLEMLLPFLGWRGVFWIMTAMSLVAAIVILRVTPEYKSTVKSDTVNNEFKKACRIFTSSAFFKFAPATTFFPGGFMALQSLWAVPWLMNVEGMSLADAASSLLILNGGMLTGQLLVGFFGTSLVSRGFSPLYIMRAGYGTYIVMECLILFGVGPSSLLWYVLGISAASNSQTYIASSKGFPNDILGRVVTTFNLMSFIGAFAVQWGMGIALDSMKCNGHSINTALFVSFAVLIGLQFLSYLALYKKDKVISI
ncbi:MAG: MFS transporter [Fibrobacteres bacterium]|nr:MFS transporter [Fibrobacterota bacterium]